MLNKVMYRRLQDIQLSLVVLACVVLIVVASSQKEVHQEKKLKVIIAGAHPDDPETGAGGTMALYSKQGHQVVSLYLTRGEAGIPGKTHDEAAAIRTKEAEEACLVLGVRPLFFDHGEIDGNTTVNNVAYAVMLDMFTAEKPDVVFTHWPIDSHRDHRATSLLVFDVWQQMGKSFQLYYFEVLTGEQTKTFAPTDFVNINSTNDIKKEACYKHQSQRPDSFWPYHTKMAEFRGMQRLCPYAEAFVRHEQSADTGYLLPTWE